MLKDSDIGACRLRPESLRSDDVSNFPGFQDREASLGRQDQPPGMAANLGNDRMIATNDNQIDRLSHQPPFKSSAKVRMVAGLPGWNEISQGTNGDGL